MQEMVIFEPKQMLGILDLRSLGYYKINQGHITTKFELMLLL